MSDETKFTKGKLEVFDESVVDDEGNLIVEFNGEHTGYYEDEANAKLFKTAPKLYERIEELNKLLLSLAPDVWGEVDLGLAVYFNEELLAEARGE